MTDEVDRAAELTDAWNSRCVRHSQRVLERPGTLLCEDCDIVIPERRRQALPSATRCAQCQELVESRRRAR